MKFISIDYIQQIIGTRKVVLWGASNFLKSLFFLKNQPISNIVGIIDENKTRIGEQIAGYKIYSPDDIPTLKPDSVLVTIYNNNVKAYKNISSFLSSNHPNIELLPNIFDCVELKNQEIIKRNNTDLLASNIFFNLINNSSWIKQRDFVPVNAAANCSFLLLLYSILEYIQPQSILEFGLGQTSKLTTQYVKNKNKSAGLKIVEHDKSWINYFSQQLSLCENTKIINKDICNCNIDTTISTKYANLSDIMHNEKYDLLIIDGPIGSNQKYPRSNILDFIPQCLSDEFIIIFDDVNRIGERQTAALLLEKLKNNNINFVTHYRQATKDQLVIASNGYKYATFY